MKNKFGITQIMYETDDLVYQYKCLCEEMSFEEALKNIKDIDINLLRKNGKIHFSEEQFDTLILLQEITGGQRQTQIYIIPTKDKPVKFVFEN